MNRLIVTMFSLVCCCNSSVFFASISSHDKGRMSHPSSSSAIRIDEKFLMFPVVDVGSTDERPQSPELTFPHPTIRRGHLGISDEVSNGSVSSASSTGTSSFFSASAASSSRPESPQVSTVRISPRVKLDAKSEEIDEDQRCLVMKLFNDKRKWTNSLVSLDCSNEEQMKRVLQVMSVLHVGFYQTYHTKYASIVESARAMVNGVPPAHVPTVLPKVVLVAQRFGMIKELDREDVEGLRSTLEQADTVKISRK